MGHSRTPGYAVGVCITLTLLAGCSSSAGASTTCMDFQQQNTSKPTENITEFMKGRQADPSGSEIAMNQGAASALCALQGNQDRESAEGGNW